MKRRARASKRDARTNVFGLWATARASSACAARRPGKLSKVRTSSTSSSRNVAGPPSRPRAVMKNVEQRVEGLARAGRRVGRAAGERRRAADGVVAALGRRGDALDVDVLRALGAEVALDAAQALGAAGAAAADDDGDRRALVARARPLEQLTIEEHGSRHGADVERERRSEWPGVRAMTSSPPGRVVR